jgi:hypothetical protein
MTVVDTLSRLFKQKIHIQKGGEEILVFVPVAVITNVS